MARLGTVGVGYKELRKALDIARSRNPIAMAADPEVKKLADGPGRPVGNVDVINIRPTGTSSEYLVRRLKRDAPEIEPMLAEEAKKRQRAGGVAGASIAGRSRPKPTAPKTTPGKGDRVNKIVYEPNPKKPAPQAIDEAAKLTGTNRQYVSDAKKDRIEACAEFCAGFAEESSSPPCGGQDSQRSRDQ